jgi:hypothetical protein
MDRRQVGPHAFCGYSREQKDLVFLSGMEFNIKMDLLEIGLCVVDWIGLAQDRYRWRALVNSVMNLPVP